MSRSNRPSATPSNVIRLRPGLILGALLLVLRFLAPAVFPDWAMFGIFGGLLCAFAVLIWWTLFSRAPGLERWGAPALVAVALAATPAFLDESIRTAAMGALFYLYALPAVGLALVVWAAVFSGSAVWPRRAALIAAITLSCGVFALLRSDGLRGSGGAQLAWRWSPTAEQRLLAVAPNLSPRTIPPTVKATPAERPSEAVQRDSPPAAPSTDPKGAAVSIAEATDESAAQPPPAWPGFRGPGRDGVARGGPFAADWNRSPPRELWRRPLGPAWSSFAVDGDRLYTQEQRGDEELVSCYSLVDGRPIWIRRDAARFWESNAGAGPRATPTLSDGRVYALGATGLLNVLDARDGQLLWSRDAAQDADTEPPYWGFAASPLLVDDLVVVALGGRLAAYDRSSGERRWIAPDGGDSYSSPARMTIDGVPQIVFASGAAIAGFSPLDGTRLWQHVWEGAAILQPAQLADGDVLFAAAGGTGGLGLRRVAVSRRSPSADEPGAGWTTATRWTSADLKPYFNDFVVHKGHAYGFDGRILACIDLVDGERNWKGGRYGNGQFLLLEDQDLLLVLSEDGEAALVGATPEAFLELARRPAIEGKTWNHPALAGDVLLARNDREMAAFRLPLQDRRAESSPSPR